MVAQCGGPEQSGRNMDEQISNYLQRRSVAFSLEYPISKDRLWHLISQAGNLNQCHPFCLENEVINWDENSHADRLTYLNGLTYIRRFLSWKETEGYDLLIGKEEGPQSYVNWEISQIDENKSSLTITVYPYLLVKLNKIVSFFSLHPIHKTKVEKISKICIEWFLIFFN